MHAAASLAFDLDGSVIVLEPPTGRLWLGDPELCARHGRVAGEDTASPATFVPSALAAAPVLPWTRIATFRARQGVIRVEIDDPVLFDDVLLAAAPARCDAVADSSIRIARNGELHAVWYDGELQFDDASRNGARWGALHGIVQLGGREPAREAFLHAASACAGERCVVLAGSTGSGKSTLLLHLLDAGLRFVADDIVPLTGAQGTTEPVPLGLSCKRATRASFAALIERVGGPGGRADTRYLWPPPERRAVPGGALRATLLVFPRYAAGARFEAVRQTPLETLVALTASGSLPPRDPEAFAAFLDWLRATPAWSLNYADAADAVRFVAEHLTDTDPP